MPKFSYTAINKAGKQFQGSAEATSRQGVIDMLVKQGSRPVVVRQDAGGGPALLDRLTGGNKVKLKDLVMFTRQMSTLVSAGVPLTRSLATLQGQTRNKYFKTVIGGISKDVESGIALGDAFAKYPGVFSEI